MPKSYPQWTTARPYVGASTAQESNPLSREQSAKSNLRAAIRAAGAAFELKDLTRVTDGYTATFQMGMVTHLESGINEAVVEDAPPTEALRALIRRVQAVFAEMT